MGTISFFIEFVFAFPARSPSPQYLCIDFSLCLFINVYKAFRDLGKKRSLSTQWRKNLNTRLLYSC